MSCNIPLCAHQCPPRMSGLTDRQAVLVELAGMLELVSWKAQTAESAFADGQTPQDKAAAEYLRKCVTGIDKLRQWATQNGWRPVNQQPTRAKAAT